jgi:homoserine O-succinyltransferase/O-acetyltransferase
VARSSKVTAPAAASGAAAQLVIGLINNMPDAALSATERQFQDLLGAAAQNIRVRLQLFSLPSLPRTQKGYDHLRAYRHVRDLLSSGIDGIIVTGTEPRAASLEDEPYWEAFTQLVEWAKENTASAIWSCLAAHAGVLHLDGIRRKPLAKKQLGVFQYARATDHSLLAGMPATISVAHSRYNDLQEPDLCAAGYTVLTRSSRFGVDTFLKRSGKSLFVFFQGHPEYDETALLREYRRDIGRFLRRERECYPGLPCEYFDKSATEVAASFEARAIVMRDPALLEGFPYQLLERGVIGIDRTPVVQLYRNWLLYLRERNSVSSALPSRRAPHRRHLANAADGIA